ISKISSATRTSSTHEPICSSNRDPRIGRASASTRSRGSCSPRRRPERLRSGVTFALLSSRRADMLFLVLLLIVLWFLGFMTSTTLGGALHILLVIAIILFLVHIIQGSPIGDA